jgi:hypothetical protein
MILGPNSSRVPSAVRAIHDALAAGLPNAIVIVGPGDTEDPGDGGIVFVGVSDADEIAYAEAVTGGQHWAQLGGKHRDEQFTVHCVAVFWTGTPDGPGNNSEAALTVMDGAYYLLSAIESALVSDPTLGGALLYAIGVSSQGLKFSADKQGLSAHVPFDIECRTRI